MSLPSDDRRLEKRPESLKAEKWWPAQPFPKRRKGGGGWRPRCTTTDCGKPAAYSLRSKTMTKRPAGRNFCDDCVKLLTPELQPK